MKPFPPVLREKKRYIYLHIHSLASVNEKQVSQALSKAVLELLGVNSFSTANFSVIESSSKKAIVKTTHKSVEKVIAALTLLSAIEGKPAWVEVLAVSGTLKKLRSTEGI